jgi:DNA polymerase III epsilon subunit-like protein
MKYLYFDTETTGLPPKGARYNTDYDQFPHIVQLSWWFDGQFYDFIIKPKGWTIPEQSTEIHGITTEKALTEGQSFKKVIEKFAFHCDQASKVVAHNIYFDTSIIKANTIREFGIESNFYTYLEESIDKSKRIDTMMKTIKYVGAKKDNGGAKFPTLEELYFKLFEESFPAHNALEDVKALKRCHEALVDLYII